MNSSRQQRRARTRAETFREVTAKYGLEPRRARRRIARRLAKGRAERFLAAIGMTVAVWVTLGWIAPPEARGQGSRKDDIVLNARGQPMAGATIRVCTAAATGQPCSPLAAIFSDQGLTQALANPTTTDGMGNYSFYAAPGRYMIEISGPSITTKQIPNVILPSDPTAPTYTSLTTTGGITGFSLTLSGNLTVSGSAAVTGALTVGGASVPTAGSTNTWGADQYFKSGVPWYDVKAFGARGKGGIFNTTTGSITAGTPTLTLASALDFINGEGILVFHAGANSTLPTAPAGVTVRTAGVAGTTSYTYQVVAVGANGDYSPASAATTITTGNATLGSANSFSIVAATGASRATTTATIAASPTGLTESGSTVTVTTTAAHGLAVGQTVTITGAGLAGYQGSFTIASVPTTTTFTYTNQATGLAASGGGTVTATLTTITTTAAHNFVAGDTVTISGVTGGTAPTAFNGTYTIATVPSTTTFTYSQQGLIADAAGGGTASVPNGNVLSWTAVTGAVEYVIYRGAAPGAYYDRTGTNSYRDIANAGIGVLQTVPSTAPTTAGAQYLVTTISSGAGTTTLTLAANATNTATSQTVRHDDTGAFQAAINAATVGAPNSTVSGAVYISGGSPMPKYVVGSLTIPDLSTGWLVIHADAEVDFYQPFLPGNRTAVVGRTAGATGGAFIQAQVAPFTMFANNAVPNLPLVDSIGKGPVWFEKIYFDQRAPFADAVRLRDLPPGVAFPTYHTFKDSYFSVSTSNPGTSTLPGSPFNLITSIQSQTGPFGFNFENCTFGAASSTMQGTYSAAFTNAGIIRFYNATIINRGMLLRNAGAPTYIGDMTILGSLSESLGSTAPALTLDSNGGGISSVFMETFEQADGLGMVIGNFGGTTGNVTIIGAANNNGGFLAPGSQTPAPFNIFGSPGTSTAGLSGNYRFFGSGSNPVVFSSLTNTNTGFSVVGRQSINAGTGNASARAPLDVVEPVSGSSGASVAADAGAVAVFDGNNAVGTSVYILNRNAGQSALFFGNPASITAGRIFYNPDTFTFGTATVARMTLSSTGLTLNGATSGGVTLQPNATASGVLTLPNGPGTISLTSQLPLSGTTGSIGGGALAAGACTSGTVQPDLIIARNDQRSRCAGLFELDVTALLPGPSVA